MKQKKLAEKKTTKTTEMLNMNRNQNLLIGNKWVSSNVNDWSRVVAVEYLFAECKHNL